MRSLVTSSQSQVTDTRSACPSSSVNLAQARTELEPSSPSFLPTVQRPIQSLASRLSSDTHLFLLIAIIIQRRLLNTVLNWHTFVKRLNGIALHEKPISELCHMGSHHVTCQPTQVNVPRHNPSHAGRYSRTLPRRDGRLSWPWCWLYWDGLPVHRRHPSRY